MAIAQKRAQSISTALGGTFNLPNNTVSGTPTLFDGHTATKNQNVYGASGPFKVLFGTGRINNVYFTGGDQKATTVTGLAGNDSMFLTGGAHGTYTVNMGTGQNTLSLGNAFGSVTYTNTNAAATTYDTLDLSTTTSNFTAVNLLVTTGAVATTSGAIADVHSMKALKLGSGTAVVTLNNLDDTLTFGNGQTTVTGGSGDDVYAFGNFTGSSSVTHTITDNAGYNTLDFTATSSNIAVNFTSATAGSAIVTGTGAGAGKLETANFSGTTGIANIIGGSGNDTYTFGNTAGTHSVNGGTGSNTLSYTGSQGVTVDLRDHEMSNAAGTSDVTFHNISTYKILGAGSNTVIGDATSGNTYYFGNGSNYIDTLGGTATIHNDMGGQTTLVMGNGYGAMTVTNTAGAGRLTVDASAVTYSLGTVTLGVGNGTALIDDSHSDTITWASTSSVTGFVGNDQNTIVSAAGNLNFRITTGAGDDAITSSGTGSSTINTGNGTDAVTVGSGANTIIFGSGTDTLTAGNGNNSVFFGGGTSTDTLGNGANVLDFSNGGTHTLTLGTGGNVLQSFDSSHTWTLDVTSTMAGAAGTLDLSNYASTDVTWSNVLDGGGQVTDVILTIGSNAITLHDYFDSSAVTAAGSAAGAGAVQKIIFSDDSNFTVTDMKGLAAAGGWN